ncbi:hypothetical protein B0H12DRAFT_1142297 [Mycena haematopus]|nr:hypothetical protein B0H12DRAFT_1142297 [Mycena haematopus]
MFLPRTSTPPRRMAVRGTSRLSRFPCPLAVDVDDHDEAEYMPPTVELQPWAPPDEWAMPDYKELGSTLRRERSGRERMGR